MKRVALYLSDNTENALADIQRKAGLGTLKTNTLISAAIHLLAEQNGERIRTYYYKYKKQDNRLTNSPWRL